MCGCKQKEQGLEKADADEVSCSKRIKGWAPSRKQARIGSNLDEEGEVRRAPLIWCEEGDTGRFNAILHLRLKQPRLTDHLLFLICASE
jgi:hypothetical protein